MLVAVWNDIINSTEYQGYKTPPCINNLSMMIHVHLKLCSLLSVSLLYGCSHGIRQKNNACEQTAGPGNQTGLS